MQDVRKKTVDFNQPKIMVQCSPRLLKAVVFSIFFYLPTIETIGPIYME